MSNKPFVLVVEDDPLQMLMAGDVVEDAGFQPLFAKNADEALALLEGREDVRVVFTDVNMPNSIDGLQLAAIVSDRWPPIDILVVSGNKPNSEAALPQRSRFFNKPYARDQLIRTLKALAK